MKSGKCPKCGSTEVYKSEKPNIYRQNEGNMFLVAFSLFRPKFAYLERYVCGTCNYVESYVADDASMNYIRKLWQPMNPRKSKQKNED